MAARLEARRGRGSGLSESASDLSTNHANRVMTAHPARFDDSKRNAGHGKAYVMLVTNLGTLVLAGFVGYAVISKVPNTLHTPLMSGTNAIHGIVILGGMTLLATGAASDPLTKALATVAVAFGAINVVGGFLVTDRMLEMFKPRSRSRASSAKELSSAPHERSSPPKELER
jgi:H+-translocating NAD(P) transhydrogenase subunit alpha